MGSPGTGENGAAERARDCRCFGTPEAASWRQMKACQKEVPGSGCQVRKPTEEDSDKFKHFQRKLLAVKQDDLSKSQPPLHSCTSKIASTWKPSPKTPLEPLKPNLAWSSLLPRTTYSYETRTAAFLADLHLLLAHLSSPLHSSPKERADAALSCATRHLPAHLPWWYAQILLPVSLTKGTFPRSAQLESVLSTPTKDLSPCPPSGKTRAQIKRCCIPWWKGDSLPVFIPYPPCIPSRCWVSVPAHTAPSSSTLK